eukprot:1090419-Alexandrium_andersonii.AAC.1
MMVHAGVQSKYVNPVFVSCYTCEDLVGRMQRVAARCTSGLQLLKLSKTLMPRYQLTLNYAWPKLRLVVDA